MAREATDRSRFPDGFRILHGKQEYITYKEHSSIRIWPSEVAAHYDNHLHSAIEVMLPDAGAAAYQLPDRMYHVEPGEILFIPSGCPHELTEPDNIRRYLLLFEPGPLYTLQDMPQVALMTQRPIYLQEPTALREQVRGLLHRLLFPEAAHVEHPVLCLSAAGVFPAGPGIPEHGNALYARPA